MSESSIRKTAYKQFLIFIFLNVTLCECSVPEWTNIMSKYAFSKHRQGRKLSETEPLKIVNDIPSSIQCVALCLRYGRKNIKSETKKCVAVNFSNENQLCELLPERICSSEEYMFEDDASFNYYDVEEDKSQVIYWNTPQCIEKGKCSGDCIKTTSTITTTELTTTTLSTSNTIPSSTTSLPESTLTTTEKLTTTSATTTMTTTPTTTTTQTTTTSESTAIPLSTTTTPESTTIPLSTTTTGVTTTTAILTTTTLPTTTAEETTVLPTTTTTTAAPTTTTTPTSTTLATTTTAAEATTTTSTLQTTTAAATTTLTTTVTSIPPCPKDYYDIKPLFYCLAFVDYDDDPDTTCSKYSKGASLVIDSADLLKKLMDNIPPNIPDKMFLDGLNISIPVYYYKEMGRIGWHLTGTYIAITFGWIPSDGTNGYQNPSEPPEGYFCGIMVGKHGLNFTPRLCEDIKLQKMICVIKYT